ncbi:MAG: hypothetical protein ACRC6V_06575 [Bacteroidales bacterium]
MTIVNRAAASLTVKQISANLGKLNKKSSAFRAFQNENLCSLINQLQHSGSGAQLLKDDTSGVDRVPSIFQLFTGAEEKAKAVAFLIKFGPVKAVFDGQKGGLVYDSTLTQNRMAQAGIEGATPWGTDLDANENPLFLSMLTTSFMDMEIEAKVKPFLSMSIKEQGEFTASLPEDKRGAYTDYMKAQREAAEAFKAAKEGAKKAFEAAIPQV